MTRGAKLVGLLVLLAGSGCAAFDDYCDDDYDHRAEYRREARPANDAPRPTGDRTQPGVYTDGKQ